MRPELTQQPFSASHASNSQGKILLKSAFSSLHPGYSKEYQQFRLCIISLHCQDLNCEFILFYFIIIFVLVPALLNLAPLLFAGEFCFKSCVSLTAGAPAPDGSSVIHT